MGNSILGGEFREKPKLQEDQSSHSKQRKTTAVKSSQTVGEISKIIRQFYSRVQEAARSGEPVAWVMVGWPPEILRAMGVIDVYTEHYAAVCAAKKAALPFLEQAEADGFSQDVCSYARIWIGYAARLKQSQDILLPEAPWGGIPKPTMMLGRGSCDAGYKGYQCLARYLDIPIHIYDNRQLALRPPTGLDFEDKGVQRRFIEYDKQQIREAVAFLEKVMGKKINWDDVSEAIVKHHEGRRLWHEIYELRKHRPCPISAADMAVAMFPLYYLMGTQEGLNIYQQLQDELKYRVDNEIGALPGGERYRLLWGGIPQWHNLSFFNSLDEAGAVFVVDHYYRDAFVDVDPSDPIEAIAKRNFWEGALMLARARTKAFGDVGDWRAGLMLELARDYNIDGLIFHLIQSCRPISIGWLHVKNVVQERLDLPVYLLESDMTDSRAYDEYRSKREVAAFVETMASRKG